MLESSIEPFIVDVVCGDRHIQHLHPTNCSVSATRLDQDGVARAYSVYLAIELDMPFALKDVVDLGQSLVVMGSRTDTNIDHMERCNTVEIVDECPARLATGTFDGRQFADVDDLESLRFDS